MVSMAGIQKFISKERVRQIETRAMEKIKDTLIKTNPALSQSVNG